MSKIKISEEKLYNLVSECVQEVIMEEAENEGLGSFLGNAYQWGKNKINNFKKDFEAGRRNQRMKNARYTPFDYYRKKGYSEDDIDRMRRMDPGAYSNERLNFVHNDMYPNYKDPRANNNEPTPNPDLSVNRPENNVQQDNPQQQTHQYQNPNQKSIRKSVSDLINYYQTGRGKRDVGAYDANIITKALQMYQQNTGMQESKKPVKINEETIRKMVSEALQNVLKEIFRPDDFDYAVMRLPGGSNVERYWANRENQPAQDNENK